MVLIIETFAYAINKLSPTYNGCETFDLKNDIVGSPFEILPFAATNFGFAPNPCSLATTAGCHWCFV